MEGSKYYGNRFFDGLVKTFSNNEGTGKDNKRIRCPRRADDRGAEDKK